jgi:RNA polymerase sigma factor (sigma-70 family)
LALRSDVRLLVDASAGSTRAFEVLVRRHEGSLARRCSHVLRDARAEDALQQGLLQAWIALQRGTVVREPSRWLHRVVQNAALDILRRPDQLHVELCDSLPADGEPASVLERRGSVRDVLAQIAALPEVQREALVRTAVLGQSHDRAAAALGVSVPAVRGLVYRARVSLRARATALIPAPLLGWVPGLLRRTATLAARLDGAGGCDGPGTVATLVKGGVLTAAVGALAAGAVTMGPTLAGPVHRDHPRDRSHESALARAAVPPHRASAHVVSSEPGDTTTATAALAARHEHARARARAHERLATRDLSRRQTHEAHRRHDGVGTAGDRPAVGLVSGSGSDSADSTASGGRREGAARAGQERTSSGGGDSARSEGSPNSAASRTGKEPHGQGVTDGQGSRGSRDSEPATQAGSGAGASASHDASAASPATGGDGNSSSSGAGANAGSN